MYVVTGAQSSVIEKVDSAGAIYAYFSSAPSVSASIFAYESATVSTTAGLTYTATSNAFSSPGLDLSFGATNDNEGYVTDDTIAFSFFTSNPENIYDIRLRFYTNSAGSAYYEKAISPGPVQGLQNAVSSNATINPDSPGMVADENGVSNAVTDPVIPTGNVIAYDVTQVGLNPAYLTPSKAGMGGWSQVEISKRSFLALGNAGTVDDGSGGQGWKTIYRAEVIIRPTTTTAVVSFKLGSIFAYGGKGVNSNYGAKLTPYSYVYTYKNKITGAESNPCIEMIPENTLNIVRQGINVNVLGTSMSDFQSLSAEVDTICIYRSGGTFADGLYRRVGVINNPGAGVGDFVDTADDLSIVGAPIAEFDNDAPVTSDIGQEYKFNLAANYPKGAATISLSTISSTMRDILTPGTIVNIGGGIAGATGKQESCVVLVVNAGSFTTYLQYDHLSGEAVIWDTNAGVACDVLCSAFNRMWVAGDAKNPHVLYSSKTGKPESFPIINQGTGNPHAIAVSSPDNPINGIAEFNGELICLCQNGIYTIRLDNGRMVGPFKTPANRGLVLKYAWGYVDNEIWFLSNDGIYAWAGAGIRKVTFAIDFVFNQKTVNGISYFDRIASAASYPLCNIQQKNNEVFFNYINTDGWFFVLRYHLLFDRWSVDEVYDPSSVQSLTRNGISLKPVSITAMVSDRAAGVLYASKTAQTGASTFVATLVKYDDVTTYTDNGEPIYYETKTKFYDMGTALAQKNFTDIGFEFTSGTSTDGDNTFFYKVYYDYSSSAGDSSASLPYTQARQVSQFPLQQTGSPLASEGKEARAAMFSLYGKSKAYNIFHNFSYTFIPLSDTIKGRVTDWDDLGHPFDKRLFNVTIEYDNGNTDLVLYLDTVSGLNSSATTLGIQTITLPAKTGRAKSSIAITADIVAKMVRLRPKVASVSYQIFNYSFQKEDYPRDVMNNTDWSDLGYQYEKRLYQLYINCDTGGANVSVAIETDGGTVLQTVTVNGSSTNRMQAIPLNKDLIGKLIRLKVTSSLVNVKFQLFDYKFDFENLPKPIVLSTPPNDFGYDYLKYAEQVSFDINTSGYNVPVSLYGDGVLMQTVTVNGTQTDRNQIVTLSPALTFRTMRLEVGAIPAGGRFQLWDYRPIFKPADKGEVFHTFDWDDLQYPYDKKLTEITIEFQTNTGNVQIAIDTLSGIDGNTRSEPFQTLTLPNSSNNRGFKTFPINETVCKMIRVRAIGPTPLPTDFKMYGYKVGNVVQYPADIVNFTDWSDLGYQYEKRLYQLYINCDTAGQNVTVNIEADGGIVQQVNVNGTATNRMQPIPINNDIIGKLIRLSVVSVPGGGKFQLFDYKFDFENLPKPIVLSTPWNDFGYDYLKYAEQISFDVNTNNLPVPVSLYGDGTLMQTVTVTGTQANRNQIITLNPALTFRTMRLEVGAVPGGGRFQLWDYRPIFKPADKGEVFHTFDWDDLQYPYDKKLTEISIEFETGAADDVKIAIDTLSGIDGTTRLEPFQTLTLPNTSGSRGFKTFPINETVCKMIRVRAIGSGSPTTTSVLPASFKMYGYKVGNAIQYPADIVKFTDWSDLGYQYEKRLYQLYVNCDTNNTNVIVDIEADSGTLLQTVTVNGTANNRMQPIPIAKDKIGKLIRLNVTSIPGGGKFQLFDYKFDFENLPKPIVLSTPWNDFGYDYLKYAEQISFDVNTGGVGVTVDIYGDGVFKQQVTVNGTQDNRNQIITLSPALTFRTMRLEVVTIPGGGRFQLWDYRPIFKPADKGEVFHTFDWDDLQYPYDKKLTEISIEFQTNTSNVQIAIDTLSGIDGNTRSEPFQTLTLPNSSNNRGFKTFPINETVCKMIRVRAIGPTPLPSDFKMYGYKAGNAVQYPADIVLFTDWSDLGYQYEKRLYQLYINCDTAGANVSVAIEADGGTVLQTVTVNGTATNRMQPIPLDKDLIGKLIRLSVVSVPGGGKFQLFDYKFDFENLPKPIVLSTPWNDFGYDYLKYAEQISFDVNTNNLPVPVSIYGDGVLMQIINVTGTQANRNQIITLNPALTFRTMRLEVGTVPGGGRFQLWDYRPIFKPADKGEVFHTFDWDDLQYPYDKKLTEISIEFETGAADDVKIAIDTLSGIDGTTQSLAFQTLTLPNTSGVRGLKTFPINETVCKLVRIRAIGSGSPTTAVLPASFKMYGYKMGNVAQYPADIVKFTDWSDLGYQYEKRLYQLYVNCDTAGQNVIVNVEADGTVLQQVTVNGTATNRMQPIPINNDIIGKLVRLSVVSIPGGGKFQLFDYKFDFENLPKPIVLSTPWNDFGYDYLKYAEQISFDVNTNNQTVPVSIYGDGTLMQTINVTGTQANRNQIITLNPALTFRTMRLEVGAVPAGGRFQLWDYRPIFKPADKGEVFHTFDWDDVQYPYDKKLTEITIEFETGASDDVKIALDTLSGLDGTTLTSAFQTLTLPNTSGSRGFKTFAINETICKMIRIRAIGSGSPTTSVLPSSFKMYGYKLGNVTQYPADIVFFTDWSDLGYQYEKRFYQLFMNCDTNGFDVTVNIEADGDSFGISSIASQGIYVRVNTSANHFLANGDKVYIKAVTGSGAANVNGTWIVTVISATAFMLNDSTFTGSPTGGTAYKILQQVVANATTTNRMLTFAMDKDLIGKLVRLNVVNIPAGGKFQLFDQKFEFENLPKPIVLSTPWADFGYDYVKYAEQLLFDVNTNGVQIPVDIYCDGVWKQRIIVSGTQQSRNFNCTLNPAITFQTMRLQINPDQIPSGGRFQLWEYKPVFRPADKGEVNHTFDWDNLEHPYDKKISEVTIEFETNGKNVAIALDTLTGINGNTENLAVQTFTLNSTGRGYKTFPINETICKMVRIRAVSTAGRNNRLDPDFKMYGYKFGNTAPYPPDIQRFSEWADLDYPCDKIFRGVGLTIDTGGVNCTVVLEVDGVASQTFTVNTTSASRQTFLTAQTNTEIIGKLYRLTFTPGAGGKAQVFGAPAFNTVKDSCPFVFLDSYEQGLGSVGYSVLKQFWADYKCAGSITVKFYNEQNVLFYSKTLGPHTSRDVDRFYLPTINGSVINKSKKHRVTIEAVDPTKPFKWYRDASRLEYINLSSDQRQGYYQFIPWTNMQLPV